MRLPEIQTYCTANFIKRHFDTDPVLYSAMYPMACCCLCLRTAEQIYRVFHDLWTLLQEAISYVFVIKISYKNVPDFGRLRIYGHFLISLTRPRVNRVLRNQLTCDVLNLVASCLRQLQRVPRAVHNRVAACVAVGGGIFENQL